MRLWSRTSVVAFAVTLVTFTGCARQRSGDVQEGQGGSDAVEVVQHDDVFEPGRCISRSGPWWTSRFGTREATITTSRSTR
jgi:hypothetical protein